LGTRQKNKIIKSPKNAGENTPKRKKEMGEKNGREEEQRNLNDAGYLHLKRSQVNRK